MMTLPWKRWCGFPALLAVIFGLWFAAAVLWFDVPAQPSSQSPAVIMIGTGVTAMIEVGAVRQSDNAGTKVHLKNGHGRRIHLSAVNSRKSCGCTSYSVGNEELNPGEVSVVDVQIRMDGRSGPFREQLTLAWVDDHGRQIESGFMISGFVVPPLRLEPDALTIRRDSPEQSASAGVVVGRFHQQDSIRVESLKPGVTAEVVDGRIVVRADESAFSGQVQTASVRVTVARNANPEIRDSLIMPVRLESPGIVTVTPASILLRRAGKGKSEFHGRIVIRSPVPGDPERWQIAAQPAQGTGQLSISRYRAINPRVTEFQITLIAENSVGSRSAFPVQLTGVGENGQVLRGSVMCRVYDSESELEAKNGGG
jgi:hypothetical protein